MKVVTPTKTYNTDTSLLMKSAVKIENLGDGYERVSTCNIYYITKGSKYFIHLNQTSTDMRAKVVDVQNYFYPCSAEFAKSFNRSYDYIQLLNRPCFQP